MPRPILRAVSLFALVFLFAAGALAQGTTTGFAEKFALSSDRKALLAELIPGSEDFYFYSCLERQHARGFAEVAPLLKAWIQAHGRTARVVEIEGRQALLTFGQDPAATYQFLRERTGLQFDAERQSAGAVPDLPTVLDPAVLSPAKLTERALQKHPGTLSGFRDSALERLATGRLTDDRLMTLLKRLQRPDVPNLPALIARNLGHEKSGGFGSLSIHGRLLLAQFEELAQLRPALLGEGRFVEQWLRRLRPGEDVQWRRDAATRLAYLERLQAFVDRLPPAHNSLKAHVLYHRLRHDLAAGTLDRGRFLTYLRLPRQAGYVNPDHLRRRGSNGLHASLDNRYPTGFGPVGDDETLVRACFQHFFATEDGYQPYATYVRESYLKPLFAETKVTLGQGDMERWYAMLGPVAIERLKQRVEFAFAPTQRAYFGAGDAVTIDADVKNVDKLLVKVFVIDTYDFERENGKPVDASIDLDGLVANEEQTFDYDDNPLRRVRRHFEFPSLTAPGTYVIEFLGNGLSSRAVIRKGRLSYVSRTGAAGHVLTVLDEQGEVVRDATVWCAGHEYEADERGAIDVPFAPARVKTQRLVLRHGRLTALERLDHLQESYALSAGVFVAREALLAGAVAELLVRPTLTVHGVPVSLALLEDAELVITSRDLDGTESSMTVRDLELRSDAEFVQEIAVPERLRSLNVVLRGRVQNVSQGKKVPLAASRVQFDLNGIEAQADIRCPLLGRDRSGWYLEVRGKNGEVCPDVALRVLLQHRDYTDDLDVRLKTDAGGRLRLGALEGIEALRAVSLASTGRTWNWRLTAEQCSLPVSLSGMVGSTLRVPYQGRAARAERAVVSLLETVDGVFVRDAFAHVAIAGGFVELRGLPAGDYDLWLKERDWHVELHVTAGAPRRGWAVGQDRMLELPGRAPLQISALTAADDELQIVVANAGKGTRLHVFATRVTEPYGPFARLVAPSAPAGGWAAIAHPTSQYHAGRQIGDEYRYILERRYQKKYPGNMLRRPGLLLNPWELSESSFDSEAWNSAVGLGGGAGGKFGGRGGRSSKRAGGGGRGIAPGKFANIDYLPSPAPLLTNLRPDAEGVVRVPLAALGEGQLVHIVAVDEQATVYTTVVLDEQPLIPRDRTLAGGLDPDGHFSEQRRLEFLRAGEQTAIEDVTTSTIEQYDSLAKVFQLMQTMSDNGELGQFAFLTRWPELGEEEKLLHYSRHACHEVHFFLYAKDRPFFDRVIRPYLGNKADKTFLDHWLLQDDLSAYAEPWAFAQLNIVEQILLTRVLPARREAGAARVREQFELLPADPSRIDRMFRLALAGRALEADRDLGLLRELLAHADPAMEPPPPAAAAPAPQPARKRRALARDKAVKEAKDDAREALEVTEELIEEDEEEAAGELVDAEKLRFEDLKKRRGLRQLYRPPGATLAYAESNYWHVPIADQDAELITVNAFWRDFALAPLGEPFCSTKIATATRNLSEMLMALAVLDLPFAAAPAEVRRDGSRADLVAKTPMLLVRKEIRPAATGEVDHPVLISQDFYRLDARYRFDGNERLDNFITGEFLIGVPYGCQVVLTNPTSQPRKLDLLLQVPGAAMPVQNGFVTRGLSVALQPFATQSLDFAFYFPGPGDFAHFPAHVARTRDGALVAAADAVTLHVVAKPTVVDKTSWQHVSQDGSAQEVLDYLDGHNLGRLDLAKIAWRMREPEYFRTVISRLRARLSYDDELWSYGLLHGDAVAVQEWLSHQGDFLAECGPVLESALVDLDPVARRSYQRIEFDPLFHSRAHRLSSRPVILNRSVAHQYVSLLDILCRRPRLDSDDWMSVTYYLLLQDRIDEAFAAFAAVVPGELATKLQYDYFRCYLDFFTDDHALARGIAELYRDHPVERWRTMFRDVINQLDEAEGKAVKVSDADDRTQRQSQLAATEPGLELEVEASVVTLRYQNLGSCQVSYYKLDVEFSFSTSPFVQQGSGAFAYILPNRTDAVTLPAGKRELTFDLPEEYRRANVMIEVSAAGITRRQTYLSNTLAVQVVERYGQLKVTQAETGRLLPKVYVKVYARTANGGVRFHKDGYTDLRGRFDYVSVSDGGSGAVERFAILVLSETDGAVIREVAPPGR